MPYRELHDAILADELAGVGSLGSWIDRNAEEISWLRSFGNESSPRSSVSVEDLWRLYGLSRVLQLLALSFQVASAEGSTWSGSKLTIGEWSSFAERLGLTAQVPRRFSAFDCEIVNAVQARDRGAPIALTSCTWPCLMLGSLLVCRAGVSISGGTDSLNAKIAASSTLYWAYRRENRRCQDLSHGWGSNSQWRTSFRRDYRLGDSLFFNVDGQHDLSAANLTGPYDYPTDDYPLTRSERIELLTHRCLISVAEPSDDELWPYNDRIVLEA